MKPMIKVCGIQNVEEALGAVDAGANTIGMLLGITHIAEDKITPETGAQITAALPPGVRTVMVTHLLNVDKIVEIANQVGVTAVQIHDDMSIEDMKVLRRQLPNIEIIKAIHITGDDAINRAKQYAPHVDALLLDTKSGDRIGGTGQTHDWSISRSIVEAVNIPVILAGGLNPDNVEGAIEQVKPAGIDANSGLEHLDGSKDFEKIRAFVRAGKYLL